MIRPIPPTRPVPGNGNGGIVPPYLQWPITLPVVPTPIVTLPVEGRR